MLACLVHAPDLPSLSQVIHFTTRSVSNSMNGSSWICCCCFGLCWLTHVNQGIWCYLSLFPFHTLLESDFTINWNPNESIQKRTLSGRLGSSYYLQRHSPALGSSENSTLGYHTTILPITFQNKRGKDSSVLLTGKTISFHVQNWDQSPNKDTQREWWSNAAPAPIY